MAADKIHSDAVVIDVSLVKRLIATQFPQWSHLPVTPVAFGGWDNRTFHLGNEMSVRLPSAASYAAQVEKEHRWLPKLAPLLPLPIPAPLAMGVPASGYPWHWSVYRWLDGETATHGHITDFERFATDLAQFLIALQQIDPTDGPPPGSNNFFRGGPLSVYDIETRQAISALESNMDATAVTSVWETALGAEWRGSPVWVHGDVSAGNLLVKEGRLSAVIDFGCAAVGDPACDLTIAWTLLPTENRKAFSAALRLDELTWERARGWALWKALITLAYIQTAPLEARKARRVIKAVLADHQQASLI